MKMNKCICESYFNCTIEGKIRGVCFEKEIYLPFVPFPNLLLPLFGKNDNWQITNIEYDIDKQIFVLRNFSPPHRDMTEGDFQKIINNRYIEKGWKKKIFEPGDIQG